MAEQVSLCLTWSETLEDTFSHGVAQMKVRDKRKDSEMKKDESVRC